jgi:hypothetical protein
MQKRRITTNRGNSASFEEKNHLNNDCQEKYNAQAEAGDPCSPTSTLTHRECVNS